MTNVLYAFGTRKNKESDSLKERWWTLQEQWRRQVFDLMGWPGRPADVLFAGHIAHQFAVRDPARRPGEAASPDLAEEAGGKGEYHDVGKRGKYRKALPFSFAFLRRVQLNRAQLN